MAPIKPGNEAAILDAAWLNAEGLQGRFFSLVFACLLGSNEVELCRPYEFVKEQVEVHGNATRYVPFR